jgi:hypothetical protein
VKLLFPLRQRTGSREVAKREESSLESNNVRENRGLIHPVQLI